MTTKKKTKSKATAKAGAKNHVTANSRTVVARVAKNLYAAAVSHASANDTTLAQQVNRWLALGAKADGLKLTPETVEFAGL